MNRENRDFVTEQGKPSPPVYKDKKASFCHGFELKSHGTSGFDGSAKNVRSLFSKKDTAYRGPHPMHQAGSVQCSCHQVRQTALNPLGKARQNDRRVPVTEHPATARRVVTDPPEIATTSLFE